MRFSITFSDVTHILKMCVILLTLNISMSVRCWHLTDTKYQFFAVVILILRVWGYVERSFLNSDGTRTPPCYEAIQRPLTSCSYRPYFWSGSHDAKKTIVSWKHQWSESKNKNQYGSGVRPQLPSTEVLHLLWVVCTSQIQKWLSFQTRYSFKQATSGYLRVPRLFIIWSKIL